VAVLTMQFPENLIAFVQSSWLDPDKVRRMTVVGSDKMMVYDDVQATEKIRIYDKGVEKPKYYDTYAEFHYAYKYGDILIPKVNGAEPIRTELNHFLDWILDETEPLSDGKSGQEVVMVIEAAQESIKNGNKPIILAEKKANKRDIKRTGAA
jgi:predicted dehydrogenase